MLTKSICIEFGTVSQWDFWSALQESLHERSIDRWIQSVVQEYSERHFELCAVYSWPIQIWKWLGSDQRSNLSEFRTSWFHSRRLSALSNHHRKLRKRDRTIRKPPQPSSDRPGESTEISSLRTESTRPIGSLDQRERTSEKIDPQGERINRRSSTRYRTR